jgi:hypothetical protein
MPFSRHPEWQRPSGGLRLQLPIARDAASRWLAGRLMPRCRTPTSRPHFSLALNFTDV